LPSLHDADAGYPIEPGRLEHAAVELEAAARAAGLARAYQDAARARIAQAKREGEPNAAEAALAAADADLRSGLALAPADPFGWNRLAYVEYRSHRLIQAAGAWRLSIETGLFDHGLVPSRAESGLALWPYMDLPARDAFGEELYAYWRWEPTSVAGLAHRFHSESIVQQALARHADAVLDLQRQWEAMAR
jgi:hypothetical protein